MAEWQIDPVPQTVEGAFQEFLLSFGKDNPADASHYVDQLNEAMGVTESQVLTLQVDTQHMSQAPCIANLSSMILEHLQLYLPYLQNAARNCLEKLNIDQTYKFVDLQFINPLFVTDLADLKAENVGRFTRLTGTVIRTYGVFPELIRGCFKCQICQTIIDNIVQHYGYTEPVCPTCKSITTYEVLQDRSIYLNYQKIRIQDDSSGNNNMLDVVLRHNLCGTVKPGDPIILNGCLIAVPHSQNRQRVQTIIKEVQQGYSIQSQPNQTVNQQIRRARDSQPSFIQQQQKQAKELEFNLQFIANKILPKTQFVPLEAEQTVMKMRAQTQDIIKSFAPQIYGLTEVKTAVILQLIGGVEKQTTEKLQIRPDINVLLVGDPATAKSSLLKHTSRFSTRGVYTSGKSASVAGLTAAIVQDEDGEWGVEAGAILRANGGICCIDEFEKISQGDQSALHEIMEQQSVSLSKAGVQATLKAKTPVLAAMNPVNSRYDDTRSLRQNINITPAILSRFDLVFVIQDKPDQNIDKLIAQRIIDSSIVQQEQLFTTEEIQLYISQAKLQKPVLSLEAQQTLADIWTRLRRSDQNVIGQKNYRITVRQLESLVRLSEAFAKFEFAEMVNVEHVQKARELLEKTIIQVEAEKETFVIEQDLSSLHNNQVEQDDLDQNDEVQNLEKQIQISAYDIQKLALIVRFAMLSAGERSFSKQQFCELAKLNINLDQYQLNNDEQLQIYENILLRMIEDKNWVNEVEDEGYIFTHLAPEV